MPYYRTAVKINLDSIESNIRNIKAVCGDDRAIAGVVKADAYGHGAVAVAKQIEKYCAILAVATVSEAMELKNSGVSLPILILSRVDPNYYELMVEKQIRPTVFSLEDAVALSESAVKLGKKAFFHIAVDTGMSRIGFQADSESADICKKIAELPNIEAEGIFSHYASSDEEDLTDAIKQKELFEAFLSMLSDRGVQLEYVHMNNSAGVINFPESFNLARTGIMIYGLYPSDEVDKSAVEITPALEWTAKLSCVKWLPEGRKISYGGTYTTTKPTRIATVPVGYADGYPRVLSNKGYVLINGKKAPITGRVCMDQFMVDVTDIEGVEVGDEVTLIGKNGELELSAEEFASFADTINYEIICGISRRVTRIYYKNGKEEFSRNYLYY